jgi:hypothetical protein
MKHNGGGGGMYCIKIVSIYIIKEYVRGHMALRKTIIVCCIVKYQKTVICLLLQYVPWEGYSVIVCVFYITIM